MRTLLGVSLLAVSCLASAAPPVEIWSTATATRPADGWVMVYRFAGRFSPDFSKSGQPERVSIVWRYKGSKGLPAISERESMDALEDAVNGLASSKATLAFVATGNNQRLWVYYTDAANDFIATVRSVQSKASEWPLDFETAIDPEWTFHDAFVRSLRR